MKIRRSQPADGWTPIANAAARDHRLSWRARGLLVELLSYPDGWDITVDKLVAQARATGDATEGRAAMRNAVAELAAHGYVRYLRQAGEKGRWSTVMVVSDTPMPDPDEEPEEPADDRRTRNRHVGGPARRSAGPSAGRSVKPKTVTKTVTNQWSEEKCPPGRYAPGWPDAIEDEPPLVLDRQPRPTAWRDWRRDDLALMTELIGSDHVISNGLVSQPGVYPAQTVYDGLREHPAGGKDWPGRWLQAVHERDPEHGVRDYLARYGLEPA